MEARRDYAAGGMNMYGGYGGLANVTEGTANAYAGIRDVSKFLIAQGATRLQIINSFEAGTMSLRVADNSTFGLRFYDGVNAFAKGRYLFPTFTNSISREGLALPPQWNQMTNFTQWQVQPGSMYIYGRAGAQGSLGGGANQMFIPNLSTLIK